jgi:hypothetical protein
MLLSTLVSEGRRRRLEDAASRARLPEVVTGMDAGLHSRPQVEVKWHGRRILEATGNVRGGCSCRTEEDGAWRRARALRSLTETSGGEDAGVEQSEALVHRSRMTERRSWTERRRLLLEHVGVAPALDTLRSRTTTLADEEPGVTRRDRAWILVARTTARKSTRFRSLLARMGRRAGRCERSRRGLARRNKMVTVGRALREKRGPTKKGGIDYNPPS